MAKNYRYDIILSSHEINNIYAIFIMKVRRSLLGREEEPYGITNFQ